MSKPVLLDLFCGAGGAAMGYHRAGFDVVGVDIRPQPHYPFRFIQADAMTFPLDGYDAIHASPPCQYYSLAAKYQRNRGKVYPDLIPPVRERLSASGLPWVMENVEGAPLINPVMLCGSMFGLGVRRHRLFESPALSRSLVFTAAACRHDRIFLCVTGHGTPSWVREKLGRCQTAAESRAAMGIEWMNRDELSQAIPPAYTEWLGRQLIEIVRQAA